MIIVSLSTPTHALPPPHSPFPFMEAPFYAPAFFLSLRRTVILSTVRQEPEAPPLPRFFYVTKRQQKQQRQQSHLITSITLADAAKPHTPLETKVHQTSKGMRNNTSFISHPKLSPSHTPNARKQRTYQVVYNECCLYVPTSALCPCFSVFHARTKKNMPYVYLVRRCIPHHTTEPPGWNEYESLTSTQQEEECPRRKGRSAIGVGKMKDPSR